VTEIIAENNYPVSMGCHHFDSVRLSVITDLAFPRASAVATSIGRIDSC